MDNEVCKMVIYLFVLSHHLCEIYVVVFNLLLLGEQLDNEVCKMCIYFFVVSYFLCEIHVVTSINNTY